jgi:hypothetical protein
VSQFEPPDKPLVPTRTGEAPLGQVHMNIRDLHAAEIERAREFLCAQGWAHRITSPSEFRRLIEDTQRTAVAIVVTDGLSNGWTAEGTLEVEAGHLERLAHDAKKYNSLKPTPVVNATSLGVRGGAAQLDR